jgi:hypothetical protein
MRTLDIVVKAREALELITGHKPENVIRCEKAAEGWTVQVEIMELKGRLADNDMMANYLIAMDEKGEVASFERLSQYPRGRKAA